MALINCPECNAQISDAATACPQCGAPLTKPATDNSQPTGNNIPECPETHLAKSIILTIICCWPLGIPAIVNAASVNSAYIAGRYDVALQKSKDAEKWCKYCLIGGIAFWVLYILLIVIIGVAGVFAESL